MLPKRIIISRPDRIGDVVLSTGLPREIKRTFPDSYIVLLLKKYTAEIYLNNPYCDKIIISDEGTFFGKLREIRSIKANIGMMILPDKRVNFLFFLAGIRLRIGTGYKFYQSMLNVKSVFRRKYRPLRHEADYSLDFARKIGADVKSFAPEIYLSGPEKDRALQIKKDLLKGRKFLIGIHSTSGNSAPNMDAGEYRRLVEILLQDKNVSIAVTDNLPPDQLSGLPVSYPNVGKPLRESIINFAALDCLVSASTGPMQMAQALSLKTVSLFCPMEACSPELWGPIANKHSVILPSGDYCLKFCPGDPKKCKYSGPSGVDPEKICWELKKILYI